MLHVTNGDLTAERLREADLPGHVMPWRDVLHEGPLRCADDDAGFARERAAFIARCGWGSESAVLSELSARDEVFADALSQREPVLLWFEHDLYDQLQLVQILARVGRLAPSAPVDLICIDRHPEAEDFLGLSQLSPAALAGLFPTGERVSKAQLALASDTWRVLCDATPEGLVDLAGLETASLPFLPAALMRLIEEYPSARNGLSVTEHRACALLGESALDPTSLFGQVQGREAAPFMGDWSFWRLVHGLASGQAPLVQVVGGGPFRYPPEETSMPVFGRQRLSLTDAGAAVLQGARDAVDTNGLDRWVGGVHLAPGNDWRRTPDGRLVKRSRRDSAAL